MMMQMLDTPTHSNGIYTIQTLAHENFLNGKTRLAKLFQS